jgi:hypothetical protein
LIKGVCLSDKCDTFKSCAGVIIIAGVLAGAILLIRLVGEQRLQRFLYFALFLRRKQPDPNLAADIFASESRI